MNETQTTSKVYFTDFRCRPDEGRADKLKRLIKAAGIDKIDMDGKFVAIKMHFGELGNMSFLRPNYARAVVDVVKQLGGKPFLTDCNTLYPGSRKNGLKGTDDIEVPVEGGEYVKAAKIGRAVMDADVFISLTHFKGHEMAGFGGAIKNIGMGCGSRAGKKEQHCNGKPVIDQEACRGCRRCMAECANNGLVFDAGKRKMSINQDNCVGCGRCIGACNFDAISFANDASVKDLNCRMAEYTKAVVAGRPQFHVSIVCDVSPLCDCHSGNDVPILPDLGMFASADPLALDQACVDACLKQTPLPGTQLTEHMAAPGFCDHHDHFDNANPNTEYKSCLAHAEKIGLGSRRYEVVRVK